MKRIVLVLLVLSTILFSACTAKTEPLAQRDAKTFAKCDRLEIWKAVLISSAIAKQASAIIKHETGRYDYEATYQKHLAPTLKRFGIDRTQAFLIFEEEGGWPY